MLKFHTDDVPLPWRGDGASLAGKPVVASQKVGCFIRPVQSISDPNAANSNIIYIKEPYWPTKLREKINPAFGTNILLKRFFPQVLWF